MLEAVRSGRCIKSIFRIQGSNRGGFEYTDNLAYGLVSLFWLLLESLVVATQRAERFISFSG